VEKPRRPRRDRDKQYTGERQRNDNRRREFFIGKLFILLAGHFRRIGQRTHADYERFNECDTAAQHRFFEYRKPFTDRVNGLGFYLDFAVRVTHSRSRDARTAHHDSFDDGLAADHKTLAQSITPFKLRICNTDTSYRSFVGLSISIL